MLARLDRRRLLGYLLMAAGLLLLLGTGFIGMWPYYQAAQLRAELLKRPVPRTASAAQTSTPQDGPVVAPTTIELASTAQPVSTGMASMETFGSQLGTPERAIGSSPLVVAAVLTSTATPVPPSSPTRLVIPDLAIDVEVVEMGWQQVHTFDGDQSEWQIPEYAAGHVANSARLGEPGNLVISAHNNIYGRVFLKISEAWGGDTEPVDKVTDRSRLLDGRAIQLYAADGRRFDYAITGFYRVLDSGVPLSQRIANAHWIESTQEPQLTLITCWPPWSNTHRLIVVAKLAG